MHGRALCLYCLLAGEALEGVLPAEQQIDAQEGEQQAEDPIMANIAARRPRQPTVSRPCSMAA